MTVFINSITVWCNKLSSNNPLEYIEDIFTVLYLSASVLLLASLRSSSLYQSVIVPRNERKLSQCFTKCEIQKRKRKGALE